MTLCIHAGGYGASYDAVAAVVTPPPSGQHYPIPHVELIDSTRRFLLENGMAVREEQHALARGGDNYFGLFEVDTSNDVHSTIIGLRNSHNQTFSASLCVGSRVFVCDNLAFSGEVTLARKHTRDILRDLGMLVCRAIGKLGSLRVSQEARAVAYHRTMLAGRDGDHAIVELMRAGVLNSNTIRDVIREFDRPRHPEHLTDGERTVWTLFNAVTEVGTKGSNVFTLPRRSQALYGVCDALAPVCSGTPAPALQAA